MLYWHQPKMKRLILFHKKDFSTATTLYKQLTELHPDNDTYRFNLAYSLSQTPTDNDKDRAELLTESSDWVTHIRISPT
jgi:Flp pilus assembly protein TadD